MTEVIRELPEPIPAEDTLSWRGQDIKHMNAKQLRVVVRQMHEVLIKAIALNQKAAEQIKKSHERPIYVPH